MIVLSSISLDLKISFFCWSCESFKPRASSFNLNSLSNNGSKCPFCNFIFPSAHKRPMPKDGKEQMIEMEDDVTRKDEITPQDKEALFS